MINVFVKTETGIKGAEISSSTHALIRTNAEIEGIMFHQILRKIDEKYGNINEEDIIKYLASL